MDQVSEARRRREEKLRTHRFRQSIIIVTVAALVVLVASAVIFIINSDFWLIKTISVDGNQRLPAKKIVELARVGSRTNLLKLSRGRIEAKLETHPWISTAAVSRDLPNRLLIQVSERQPFACVNLKGKVYILDDKGFVIEASRKPIGDGLPVIDEVDVLKLKVGEKSKNSVLKSALASLKRLSPELRETVVWVSVPSLDKLAFHTSDNLEIIYGRAGEADKKNLVIKKILEQAEGKIIHINVTAPGNPVVRKLKV